MSAPPDSLPKYPFQGAIWPSVPQQPASPRGFPASPGIPIGVPWALAQKRAVVDALLALTVERGKQMGLDRTTLVSLFAKTLDAIMPEPEAPTPTDPPLN